MNLSGADITPSEGKVALTFVDDVDGDDDDRGATPSDDGVEYEGCIAIVVGVGAGVKGVKKGSTVIVSPWARDGLKVGDDTVICDSYCIAATIG